LWVKLGADLMFDLDSVAKEMEHFHREKESEFYLNWSGLKEEMNLSSIYEKHRHLFKEDLILNIKAERQRAFGDRERRLGYLQQFLVSNYLEMAVKELTDKFETMEAQENVRVDSEEIPFRLAAVKMANEPDRTVRGRIYAARNSVIERINVILQDRVGKLHKTARKLGYEDYVALYRDIKRIDLHGLEQAMRDFINRTDRLYTKMMREFVRTRLGIGLEAVEKHDVSYLFRGREFDRYFKREEMVETLKRTLNGIGIKLGEQKNVDLDTAERPKKSPRAFVAAIKVPDDVKLVVMPVGGYDDYTTLFHEAGHAEHFGSVDPRLEVEYKYLGDSSVTESFAFLFEYLVHDENWLATFIRIDRLDEYLDFAFLNKLFFLRRYGAKLSYELKLHRNSLEGMDEAYKTTLEEALKFIHPRSHYLSDVDDGFYCAQYLRAWTLETQLRAFLKDRFGEKWFNSLDAGRFLKDLWSKGQKYDAVEIAQTLGYERLDSTMLAREIEQHFC